MSTFAYVARTRAGEKVDGALEAPDKRFAISQLERKGYTPISVKEQNAAEAKKSARKKGAVKRKFKLERRGPARMKIREVLEFTRDISNLISSGMTLGRSLQTLARLDDESAQSEIVQAIHAEIVQGSSLSDALEKHGGTFPNFYVNMVRSGEASGRLSEAMDDLVRYYERTLEAREKVAMAMVYPSIILSIGAITVIVCMVFVVPRFTSIFADLGGELPLPTRMLIGISDVSVKYGWFLLAATVVMFMAFKRFIATDAGKRSWHAFLLKIPVIKKIIQANAFSNFARTLGSLLGNGVPVLRALQISEQTVANVVIGEKIAEARSRVTDGATISRPLSEGDVFPDLFTNMLAVGEESGDTAGSLGHIARRYDEDLSRSIKVFTTVLEPILMLFMAIIVGFVALSMLLAVFKMSSGLGM